MIDYSTMSPTQHMYCMRLLLNCLPEGIWLNVKEVKDNEIWVDYAYGEPQEELLRTVARSCGLTEIEKHHYSYT